MILRLTILLSVILLCLAGFSQRPTAAFSADQTIGCAPEIINFIDQSGGIPTSWLWDFGNGSTSTLQNPSTTYFYPGRYTVKLTATNNAGSSAVALFNYITIYSRPLINFTVDDSVGCAPFVAHFTDLSTPDPGTTNIIWQWDFSNGTQSLQQNPQVTFPTPGTYTISLKVTSDKGCAASLSKPSYIQVSGALQLAFSNTAVDRCRAPFPVSFTNSSTGPGTLSYFWNFGDGNTSTAVNPAYNYSTPGNYNVSLAVTSSDGCTDTLRKPNLISIQTISTAFTAPDSACVYAPVSFSNTSAPAAVSTLWNFGDGSTASAASPVKPFSAPGTYTVRLQQTYSYCTDSFSKTIRINPQPVPAFSAPVTMQCQPPLTVNFNNTSANGVSYQWNFGDGSTSTLPAPSHVYTGYGNFTVSLIVTNASGCTDTLIQPAFVRIQKPVIAFPTLPQLGCVPYTTTFSANINTLDVVTSYLWDFGDGTTSAAATPSHTYPTQGTYAVALTITTSTGCTETLTLPSAINTGRKPIIDFTASPNPTCAFAPVQFTGIANEGDTWLWNFGDGTGGNTQNPIHQYTDTGTYNITFTATNNGCPASITKQAFIKVQPPIARFSYTNDCLNRKRFVFTDASVGPSSWFWNFGDGTTATQQNPAHIFPAFGPYTVTLTVTNGNGCTHSKTINVDVFDEQPQFVADVTTACKTAVVTFTPTSGNLANFVAFNWTYGNGNFNSQQVGQSPFTTAGSFDITLITTDIYGCNDTVAKPGYIRINGPVAGFTASNNNGCKGLTANFTNTSTPDGVHPITSWQWAWGDGTQQIFATGGPYTHPYPAAGNYDVKLVVTDNIGCKDSITQAGVVNTSSPKADFASADTLTCLGSTVNFSNTSAPGGYASTWTFGDAGTSALDNPTHLYGTVGQYAVKLVITDPYGCKDSTTEPAYINIQKTVAAFTLSDSSGACTPFDVRFTNTSQFYQSSVWQLGNGSSTATNPVQTYNTAGTYLIKLYVTGRGGCIDSATHTLNVYDAAASGFSYQPISGCKPLLVNFSATTPATVNYFWDFGDGSVLNTASPDTVHTYTVFGNLVPKLILIDSGNCVIPVTGADTLRISGVTAKFGEDKRFFCDSGTVQFIDSTTFNDPIASYTWDFGDGGTSGLASPAHSFAAPGIYTVSVALQTNLNCKDTFTKQMLVKVVESPSIRITSDSIICRNDFVQYTGLFNRPDTSVVRWAWQFPNGGSSALQNPSAQQYTTAGTFALQAIATNSSGCADTVNQSLVVNPLPVITLPLSLTKVAGTPVVLPATYSNNVVSYSWKPAATLSCADCPQPVATPKFNTLYTVTATDSNGCTNTGRVQVIVLCGNANVFVPNTFSPNGDGANDVFMVRGKGLARVKSLRIFNRWGQVVFERQNFTVNDEATGWNGTFGGKRLPADTFIYQAEVFCENGDVIKFDGSVTLIL